jgi:membrane-bound lytic murein transglycosylase MltF
MKSVILLILLVISTYNNFTFANIKEAEKLKTHLDKVEYGGLENILKKKYLRVLTTKNPYDYYIHQGKTKGLQYEMVKEFTKYLNEKYVKKNELRIVFEMIPVDFDQLIPMLIAGKGDVIAVGLTRTSKRETRIRFVNPYQKVDDVIITRKEFMTNFWRDKIFHVQGNSSYKRILSENKINVEVINPNFNAADIMGFVSLKKYDYTLVNSFWAKTLIKGFKNLAIISDNPFRKKVKINWAVRNNNTKLLNELNAFIPKIKKGTMLGNLLNYKYFYNVAKIKSKNFDINSNIISLYDETIKKYAQKFKFDWRLLAALCFQESRFNQGIENKWGAIGLFQIKQMTANEPYIKIKEIGGEKNYDNNVHAGVKYLSWIKKRYFDPNTEMKEEAKLRMMMASYNAGPRRVQQAIIKAKEMGLDPNKWFRNVEIAMLKLGYPEPVIYVSEINKHYVSYVLLGIK